MAKYHKKPVVIEAVQFDGTPGGAVKILIDTFSIPGSKFVPSSDLRYGVIEIPTLEGVMTASAGDYIIKEVEDKDGFYQFYTCKPDVFEASYEMAD